jgi:hypothetical protein
VDLTGALLRAGAARPHVLIVTAPGGTAVRLAAEERLRGLGWPAAMSPADADLLLAAGDAAPPLARVLEAAWEAMPAPRAQARAVRPGEVAAALEAARGQLGDRAGQRALAAAAAGSTGGQPQPVGHGGDGMGGGHGGHGMGHGGHGMGGMEMPAGMPMAGRGEDRDGLRLDQLHVPLGPVLPDWPAGLVVHLTLQGDVVQHAEAEILGAGGGGPFWAEPWRRAAAGEPVIAGEAARRCAAAHLDSLGRFLAVAGWDDAAAAARRLRGEALAGVPAARLRPDVHRFARRVGRSRTLRWLTNGLGVLSARDAAAAGVRGPALRAAGDPGGGDVTDRYRRWCAELADAAASVDDRSPLRAPGPEPPRGRVEPARGPVGSARGPLDPPGDPLDAAGSPSAGLLAVLPGLLEGAELAAARLIVASLDPDPDEIAAGEETGDGG